MVGVLVYAAFAMIASSLVESGCQFQPRCADVCLSQLADNGLRQPLRRNASLLERVMRRTHEMARR